MEWYAYFRQHVQLRGIPYRESEEGQRPSPPTAVMLDDPADSPTCNPRFIQKIEIGHGIHRAMDVRVRLLMKWHSPNEWTQPHHLVNYGLGLEVIQADHIVRLEFDLGSKVALLAGIAEDCVESELDILVKSGYSLATRHDNKALIDHTLNTYTRLTT